VEAIYSGCETTKHEVEMKYINNERGVALVMALILSLIILVTVSALLYLVTQGTMMSGYQKRYQTSLEASRGGTDMVTKEVLSRVISQALSASLLTAEKASLQSTYSQVSLGFPSTTTTACLQNKLLWSPWYSSTDNWTNCGSNNKTLDPKQNPDITFQLSGPTAAENFNVYAKIVDTVGCTTAADCPNTDTSGLDLQGQGVAEAGSGMVSPKQVPYMYRLEIQAERATNPDERSNLSVLYAY
jgi:hypothetical protein